MSLPNIDRAPPGGSSQNHAAAAAGSPESNTSTAPSPAPPLAQQTGHLKIPNHVPNSEVHINIAPDDRILAHAAHAAHLPRAITEEECGKKLGYKWSMKAKGLVLTVMFLAQVSMNFNTTLFSNAIGGIAKTYSVTEAVATWGAAVFLITYAFGCELWAPWSEEYGRRPVLQLSLLCVNAFGIMAALAPNFPTLLAARALGGLSTAGGSVTLAVVADLFRPDDEWFQRATNFIVLSSVGGSIIGPVVGGFVETYLNWSWCLWIQVIFGLAVQVLHLVTVPETRASVVMEKVAKRLRKQGQDTIYGPNELDDHGNPVEKRIDWKEIGEIWIRPFSMFLFEPIVLALSMVSGFSDALIFMMIQSYSLVYAQWQFNTIENGLSFVPIGLGYIIGYFLFTFAIKRNVSLRQSNPNNEHHQYEGRLWLLLWTVPLLPIGLLMFALTAAMANPPIHWIGSMFASCLIGIANFAIYTATIDYVLRAYGPYAASATGGNGWCRDFLAGILTPCAVPMYKSLGIFNSTMMLFAIAVLFCGSVYAVYWKGPELRKRSEFAQTLRAEEDKHEDHVVPYLGRDQMPGSRANSRPGTRNATPVGSARPSIEMTPLAPGSGARARQRQPKVEVTPPAAEAGSRQKEPRTEPGPFLNVPL